MNSPSDQGARSNPFATRFTRPGAISYRFAGEADLTSIVAALERNRWRGQIVGPHGTGKSTLLAELIPAIEAAGRRAWSVALRDRQRWLPAGWYRAAQAARADLLVIDGYEQLGVLSRWLVAAAVRLSGWGLLVTSHQDVGLPTVWSTRADLHVAQEIVALLTAGEDALLAGGAVAESFAASGGNLREMLFDLYDRWEAARRRKRNVVEGDANRGESAPR